MQIFSISPRSFVKGSSRKAGFTLIELMVSIGIMLIVMSIVLFGQQTYTNSTAVDAQAQDISLSLREAQIYGVSIKERAVGTGDFASAYGVEFKSPTGGGNSGATNAYISFADRDGDSLYSSDWSCPIGGTSECLSKTTLMSGNTITSLCSIAQSGTEICTLGRLDVTFHRPATEAVIKYFDASGAPLDPALFIGARIILTSKDGSTRSVSVYQTGQISVL